MWNRTKSKSPYSRSWLVNSKHQLEPQHHQHRDEYVSENTRQITASRCHSKHDVLLCTATEPANAPTPTTTPPHHYCRRRRCGCCCCCRQECECYTSSTNALTSTASNEQSRPSAIHGSSGSASASASVGSTMKKMRWNFHTSAPTPTRVRTTPLTGTAATATATATAMATLVHNSVIASSTLGSLTATRPPTSSTSTSSSSASSSVSSPCLNQIIEVLLAILLVNCLWMIPRTEASYAAVGSRSYAPYASDGDLDINLYNPFRSSHRSSNYPQQQQQQQQQPALAYRFPHNLAAVPPPGVLGSFPIYSASQNLEDFQSPNQLAQHQRSQNFKISPKPCSIGRIEGTCMFVWECIKSEGRHVGMCVDSFMFGSCCAHNYTENFVMPQPFAYTRPTKPLGMSGLNHRPRPPHLPHKPSISGMTTIERPHGAGTLVIRPSGPHHQGALHRPHHTKPSIITTSMTPTITTTTTTTTTTLVTTTPKGPATEGPAQQQWSSNDVINDLQSASSSSLSTTTGGWNSVGSVGSTAYQQQQHNQHHWHLPTEPNFITKPRPPNWEKPHTTTTTTTTTSSTILPLSLRPKPTKPSKKPIVSIVNNNNKETPQQQQQQQHQPPHTQTPLSSMNIYTTRKPSSSSSTTTTTTTTTRRPTRPQPQMPTHYTTTSTSTTKPTKYTSRPPSTTTSVFSQSRPTPSQTSSSSLATTTTTTGTTTTSTTQKYRPTATTHKTTMTPTTTTSTKPSSMATTTTLASTTYQPATKRPTMAAPSSTTLLSPQQSTTIGQNLASQQNLSTIESNEIIDSNGGPTSNKTTIKTISAARSECGIPVLARPETRIVGGKSAAFGRWPWQVSVRRTSFFGFSSTHRCGGALINENWIATAGHCVDDLLITQIRIRVGEYDFSHVQEQLPYIERAVSKKVVHPKYNFFTYEYDLALVKLEQPLEFAPHVSPICLPETDSLLIGQNATVTGWGRLSEGGTLPSVLQEVSVPIVSNDNCKTMFLRAGRQEFIPEIFLCAGYESGGQDSCQGDSGGPLQVRAPDGRFFLAGIISWGIGCAEANLPGVCTRISKFVPWIVENVT